VIPDPSLVVLIGAAGAGKSTFAARHFLASEILSSDTYRALISGDEADQRVTRAAFDRLHRDLERRLRAGLLTVVDATNVERSARHSLLVRSIAAGLPAVAIVLGLPEAVVLARNAARAGRVVDEAVVRRHLARLRTTTNGTATGLLAEGFATAVVISDELELETIVLVRDDLRRAAGDLRRAAGDADDRGPGESDPDRM
jgi:predicted kinase